MANSQFVSDVDHKAREIQHYVRNGALDPQETAERLQRIIDNSEPYPFELPIVTSDGRTGQELLDSLRSQGVSVSSDGEDILTQDEFDRDHVSDGVEYSPTIIPANEFSGEERSTENIIRSGDVGDRDFIEPKAEVTALLAEKLSVDDMRRLEKKHDVIYLVVMHSAIIDSNGFPCLLYLYRDSCEIRLETGWENPGRSVLSAVASVACSYP